MLCDIVMFFLKQQTWITHEQIKSALLGVSKVYGRLNLVEGILCASLVSQCKFAQFAGLKLVCRPAATDETILAIR